MGRNDSQRLARRRYRRNRPPSQSSIQNLLATVARNEGPHSRVRRLHQNVMTTSEPLVPRPPPRCSRRRRSAGLGRSRRPWRQWSSHRRPRGRGDHSTGPPDVIPSNATEMASMVQRRPRHCRFAPNHPTRPVCGSVGRRVTKANVANLVVPRRPLPAHARRYRRDEYDATDDLEHWSPCPKVASATPMLAR